MSRFKKIVAMGFFVGVLAVAVAAVTLAQQRGQMGGQTQQDQQKTQDRRQQWQERRQQVLAEIRSMQQQLQDKLDALNNAQGETDQMDALIALVTEIAQQRIDMYGQVLQMQENDLDHTGAPMKHGGRGASNRPMMRDRGADQESGQGADQDGSSQ